MIEVHFMTDIHGKRFVVASPDAPVGFMWNDVIYDTAFEASKAEGETNQRCYFNDRHTAAETALQGILWDVFPSPTWDWDDQEEQRRKNDEIARGIMDALFPFHRARDEIKDHHAIAFLDEIAKAEAVYRDMKP